MGACGVLYLVSCVECPELIQLSDVLFGFRFVVG